MMEREKHIRNNSIDVIRGIAILVVVLGHSIQVSLVTGERSTLILLIQSFQMPLMFLVSGFTAGYSYPKKDSHFHFIKRKIKRLLVPYIVWAYLHYIIVCIVPGSYRRLSIESFVLEFFISDFWFLRYLFMFFLIMWICNEVINRVTNMKHSAQILILSTIIVALLDRIPVLTESISLMHWFYFVLGWVGYQLVQYLYDNDSKAVIPNKRYLIFLLGMLVIFSVALVLLEILPITLSGIPLSIFLFAFLYQLFAEYTIKRISFARWLGRNTLTIYAIHWCVLFSPLTRLHFYSKNLAYLPLSFRTLIVFVIWMLVSIVITEFIKKNRILKSCFAGE